MKRRNFLVGVGGTAIGASALVGSGAFSRVESNRAVNIEVAHDEYAYLGLKQLSTENSQNFTDYDDGHFYVDIGDFAPDDDDRGIGVNSNSRTYFEGLFEICNQGKDTAYIQIDVAGLTFHPDTGDEDNNSEPDGINDEGEPVADVQYHDGSEWVSILKDSDDEDWADDGNVLELDAGYCEEMRLVTSTFGIDATKEDDAGDKYALVEGTARVVADAPGAGEVNGENGND